MGQRTEKVEVWRVDLLPDVRVHTEELGWRMRLVLWLLGVRVKRVRRLTFTPVLEVYSLGYGKGVRGDEV